MIRLFLIIILLFSFIDVFPQYPFDSIPDNLKKRADAVVRTEQCLFTVKGPGRAAMKIKKAVTLLNEDAENYRYLSVGYNKYSKVNYLIGAVYSEKGELVKKLGLVDVFDMSAISGGTFYSDDRVKAIRFPLHKYPYTVEYEYEVEYSSLPGYPSWNFQDDRNVSVEKSGIQFVIPKEMKIRYVDNSLENKADSVILEDKKIYTWQETNISALPVSKTTNLIYDEPVLHIAPLEFEFAGKKGSLTSWKTFGDWAYSVNKDRDALPEDEIAAVKSLASKYNGQKQRIKAIYEYMQSKTRYVSVQIGVGGWQTAEADAVAGNGFGDCKALSNYTMALMKAAGIKSYLTLVNAGFETSDINTKFVDFQFNHVILCVPLERDTVWLECTSQTLPFNYLSGFTSDRHVLVLTPDGGKLVRTPAYRNAGNILKRSGSFFLNPVGASSAKLTENFSGSYFDNASRIYSLESEDEMKKTLNSSGLYPDFTVTSASFKEQKSENPTAEFQYQLSINEFGTRTGNRLYFRPAMMKEDFLQKDTFGIKIPSSKTIIDSVIYWIPQGYSIEKLPESVSLRNEYGNYSSALKNNGDRLIYYRRLDIFKGIIPKNEYSRFRDFYNTAASADRGIVILTKAQDVTMK